MEFAEALELVIAHTKHERFRELTAAGHPDRDVYRRAVLDLAAKFSGQSLPEDTKCPDLLTPVSPNNGRLKVGLWVPTLAIGGAETWAGLLARMVDQSLVSWRGCAVTGGNWTCHPDVLRRVRFHMPVVFGRDAARCLAERCDVLVTSAVADVAELLDGVSPKPRVIAVCHVTPEGKPAGATDPDVAGVDRFVAVSEMALPAVPESHRARATVILNAVDEFRLVIDRPREEMRRRWGVPDDAPVAGFLGRISEEKDPGAMVRLAESLPEPWHVVVVGDGRWPGRLPLAERLHWLPADPAAGDVINAFDVLVVPSLYESFGLTIAEGLWMGVPVVATPVGINASSPHLAVRTVPVAAPGDVLARAVMDSVRTNINDTQGIVHRLFDPDRFGREWTRELYRAAGRERKPRVNLDQAVQMHRECVPCKGMREAHGFAARAPGGA